MKEIRNPILGYLAVYRRGRALKFLSQKLRNNERIAAVALSGNGLALEYVISPTTIDWKRLVLIAVEENGLALRFARWASENEEVVR